ncbi:MAG: sulfatase-like hydrolase/transferase [Verrucomicrobiota bacterium]
MYQPDEIPVHPTIPDTPAVRFEQACYFSSVRRFDDVAGRAIRVLEDRNLAKDTLVILLSDHGMAVPSAKSNCYPQSTRTPFVLRWDGKIKPGQEDKTHIVSTLDILPTILDAAGIENPEGMDGRSLTSLFNGGKQDGRDHIFTQFYMKIGQTNFQMRAWQNTQYAYVFNPWHNGKPVYNTSSMGGSCFAEILRVGESDPIWAERADYLLARVPEEFFNLNKDPHCLNNLIAVPRLAERIDDAREKMAEHLKATEDPMADVFNTWQTSKDIGKMEENYLAMWDKHGIPGRPAKNEVNMEKWLDPDKVKKERREKRKASD